MASAWGSSWGVAWGDSWGIISSAVVTKTTSGGYDAKERSHNIFKPSGEPIRRKKLAPVVKPTSVEPSPQAVAAPVPVPGVEVPVSIVFKPYVEPVLAGVIERKVRTDALLAAERRREEEFLLEWFMND